MLNDSPLLLPTLVTCNVPGNILLKQHAEYYVANSDANPLLPLRQMSICAKMFQTKEATVVGLPSCLMISPFISKT